MLPPDENRVFFSLIPIVDTGHKDHLTKFQVYKHDTTTETLIMGLPAIQSSGKFRYMVPVTLQDPTQRCFRLAQPCEASLDDILLLYVDWEIHFA